MFFGFWFHFLTTLSLLSCIQAFSVHPLLSTQRGWISPARAATENTHCRRKEFFLQPTEQETSIKSDQANSSLDSPDPSVLLSAQPDAIQRWGFVAISVALVIGSSATIHALDLLESILPDNYFNVWRSTWPIPLGLIYVAAGVAHFAIKESFTAMVPPLGTWGGLWQIPAPGAEKFGVTYEEYHNYWTGICEVGGGTLLIIGSLNQSPQIPAFLLLLLTIAITPANIYMATHDIRPPGQPPIPYPNGHVFRGVLQCLLLAFFFRLAFQ